MCAICGGCCFELNFLPFSLIILSSVVVMVIVSSFFYLFVVLFGSSQIRKLWTFVDLRLLWLWLNLKWLNNNKMSCRMYIDIHESIHSRSYRKNQKTSVHFGRPTEWIIKEMQIKRLKWIAQTKWNKETNTRTHTHIQIIAKVYLFQIKWNGM